MIILQKALYFAVKMNFRKCASKAGKCVSRIPSIELGPPSDFKNRSNDDPLARNNERLGKPKSGVR
jgi:hypothetical protein